MQVKSQQKMNANQVICGECGNLCDFSCDKCPACGAPLFGDEPHEQDENQPLILKLPDPPDLHYTEPTQLSEANRGLQIKLCILLLIGCIIVCSIILL